MNRAERFPYPFAAPAAARLAAAWARVREVLIAFSVERARNAAIRDLERLSDSTLRDLGLHRSQVGSAPRRQTPWW